MKSKDQLIACVGMTAALTFGALRGGAATNITEDLTLNADLDLREFGAVTIAADATVALNGHKLTVAGLVGSGTVINSRGYRYYKFKVDAVCKGTSLQISEVKLFSGDTDVSRAPESWGSSSNWTVANGPAKALDGNTGTKWYDDTGMENNWFVLDYGEPRVITRYQWYTCDDTGTFPGRNPKSWRFQGSNDKTNWTDLDVVENAVVKTDIKALAYEKDLMQTAEVSARLVDVYSLVKSGAGTVQVSDTVLASVANVAIDAGVVRVKRTDSVKAASTPGEIHIADGAQLDLNAPTTSANTLSVAEAIHGKTIYVAGAGLDGKGVIYNSLDVQGNYTGPQLGSVVLTGDALLGSANGRIDMRPLVGSSAAATQLAGGHTLTVGDMGSGGFFGMNCVSYALDMMRVTGRANFEATLTGTITNGVRMADGAWVQFSNATVERDVPFAVEPDATVTVNTSTGASTLNGSFTVGVGASVSVASAQNLTLAGAVTNEGAVAQTGASALILAGTLSGRGSLSGANVRFAGASTCWRMVVDDTDFTSKVDVDGVTDATFLAGLKRMEIVYTGEAFDGKVYTICSVANFAFTQGDANNLSLDVANGAGMPIENCWLEVADGQLRIHFAERTARTAEWTNESGDGNVANPENWICRDEADQPIPSAVPTLVTTLLIGADSRFVCTNEAPMVCLKVKFEPGASLAADCDWRGLAGVPFEGTLDLAGHRLIVGSLLGPATLTDSGHGAGFKYIRFKVCETQGSVLHAEGGRDANDSAQLCEVKLFNGTNDVTRPYRQLIYDEATFDSGLKAKFNPTMAVDGNLGTEWYDNRLSKDDAALRDSVWFILEYENPIVLTHYEWWSGLDTISTVDPNHIYRHPQEWQLEGSNDGVNWVTLDALHAQVPCPDNNALSYRGPAMDPAATPGVVQIDVPAGKTETNGSVALQNGVRLEKTGEGKFVAACAGQTYAGGTVVSEGVVKPSQTDVSAFGLNNTSRFGLMNSVLSVTEGAQYWDDVYAPGATKNIRFRVAGTGPDGTGAIRTSHNATSGNNANEPWCTGLELSGDAEIARDAYAFSLIAYNHQRFPLTLNGHTLTFTSDTLTSDPYLLASSVRGTTGDTGTIVIGDNIQLYPYQKNDSDLSNDTLVITTNAIYSTGTDENARNLTTSNLVYRSTSRLSQYNRLTTVLGSYAPASTNSAPKVQLGDATHLATTIDLSERTTTFDVAFGGGLAFAPGSVVTVRLGTRRPKGEARKLLAWSARPKGVKFVLCEENLGGVIAGEDGLYLISGMTIIFR